MSDTVVELRFRVRDVFAPLSVDGPSTGIITLDHMVPIEDEESLASPNRWRSLRRRSVGTSGGSPNGVRVAVVEPHPDPAGGIAVGSVGIRALASSTGVVTDNTARPKGPETTRFRR
ncbi:hypothetical protein [Natrinema longum]|uniref:hypothetical protein n=1 Tax=Natrinema longum TaxID=370324 RepID=UPI001CCF9C5E|nr:hypothetical protein [Natrinema longum]MBZ6496873.1 hypothetical protein [Natrinema longum]